MFSFISEVGGGTHFRVTKGRIRSDHPWLKWCGGKGC